MAVPACRAVDICSTTASITVYAMSCDSHVRDRMRVEYKRGRSVPFVVLRYEVIGLRSLNPLTGQHQSRTGGVLGAVPSAAVMGARRIFSRGGKFRDAKKLTTFLVVTLKTQVFTVTNAQNTLQHFRGEGKCPPLKHFIFLQRGARVRQGDGGTYAMAQWHNGQSKPGQHKVSK